MSRGIELGCEQCDYSATLYERLPFTLDAAGESHALPPESTETPAGYWTDGLCGACRRPVRVICADSETPAPGGVGTCPHCGGPALTFEQTAHELAQSSHSRAWLDLHREQDAAGRLEAVLGIMPRLQSIIRSGEATTVEALDALAQELAAQDSGAHALDGIDALLENALDLDAASQILRARLQQSTGHIAGLRQCADDEAHLPGVPCPHCQTGHLIHWPIWV